MKIVTLTLSAAYDMHCYAEKIEVNHENLASISEIDAGGKGVNISRALRCFDMDSISVVVLGDENGDDFAKKLEKENISLQKIAIRGRIRENITIHTADGKETRISFTGGKTPSDLLEQVEKITDEICDNDTVLTFTGRVPEGVSMPDVKAYLGRLVSRGVSLIVDSRSFTLPDIIEVKPFLIKPNEEEIVHYMKRDISDTKSASLAAEELRQKGIKNVMISLGARGAVIASPEGVFSTEAPKVDAISTIGAGDSSIAGFLYAIAKGESVKSALETAVAFGSAACMTAGTKPPRKEDVNNLLAEMRN